MTYSSEMWTCPEMCLFIAGRVSMLAALGFLIGEQLESFPVFLNADGHVTGPAINHFQQVEARGAIFWCVLHSASTPHIPRVSHARIVDVSYEATWQATSMWLNCFARLESDSERSAILHIQTNCCLSDAIILCLSMVAKTLTCQVI